MTLRIVRAFLWMRVKVFLHAFKSKSRRDTLEQTSRALSSLLPIIILVLLLPTAALLGIAGFVGYGRESWNGGEAHTFQITHDLLVQSRAPVSDMVTHVYPLQQYRDALSTAANRRKTGSIKVLLDPSVEG